MIESLVLPIVLIGFILIGSIVCHHKFLIERDKLKQDFILKRYQGRDTEALEQEVKLKLAEIDHLKSRIDALYLKSGLKL